MDTLDQMKAQLQLLRAKLDEQQIVNDRLIRQAVRRKVHSLNREAFLLSLLSAAAIPYCVWFFHQLHVSWVFAIVTALFLLLAIIYTYLSHRGIRSAEIAGCTLAEITRRVAHTKLLYSRWLRVGIPFAIGWFVWFAYEITTLPGVDPSKRSAILTGAAIGGAVGAVVGLLAYRRTQRLANEILEQLKEQE